MAGGFGVQGFSFLSDFLEIAVLAANTLGVLYCMEGLSIILGGHLSKIVYITLS
jgi:hypothetical protein